MANLLIEVLRSYRKDGKFEIHDFVVMPDHIHLLMTIPQNQTLEQSMQLIKGSFSFRARKELGFKGEVWSRGFSDVQVRDERSFIGHRSYIELNPVRAGLCNSPEEYPFGSVYLKRKKLAGAKAQTEESVIGTTEVVP
jgi:putative transposase